MRIIKYAFVVSVLMFILVTVEVPSKASHPPQHSFELILCLIAVVDVGLGLAARSFLAKFTKTAAQSNSTNAPLNQWMSANIVSLALIESCALFAVVLHMLGSSTRLVGIVFGCALLALFVWNPGKPPLGESAGDQSPQIRRLND